MTPLSNRGALAAWLWAGTVFILLHIGYKCLDGYLQCRVLGCLPW